MSKTFKLLCIIILKNQQNLAKIHLWFGESSKVFAVSVFTIRYGLVGFFCYLPKFTIFKERLFVSLYVYLLLAKIYNYGNYVR